MTADVRRMHLATLKTRTSLQGHSVVLAPRSQLVKGQCFDIEWRPNGNRSSKYQVRCSQPRVKEQFLSE